MKEPWLRSAGWRIGLMMVLAAGLAGAQTIYNPSFESNTFSVYPGYCNANTNIAGWTASNPPQTGLDSAGSSAFDNNGATPDGVNVAFIQSSNGTNNWLATTISNLTAGTLYRVSCRVNSRTNYSLPTMGLNLNGAVAYTNTVPPVGLYGDTTAPYGYAYGLFTAASNTALLLVSCTATATNGYANDPLDGALLLDNFQIAALTTNYFAVTPWTGDGTAGVDATNTLWAYAFGTSANESIDGVTFAGVAGGSPAVAGAFAVTGDTSVYTGESPDYLSGAGSAALASDFVWGGNPATVTVSNLTAGASYRLTIYGAGFDRPYNRYATFSAPGDQLYVDEDLYGEGNGLRVDYHFTATAASTVVTITPANSGNTFHIHGLALTRVVASSQPTNVIARALPLYYCTSSTILPANTVDSVVTNGSGQATLITATGAGANQINRCTALAVDSLNGKLFLADAQTMGIFSANLDGSGLTVIASGLTAFPTDLALDVTNQVIYFTTSSSIQTNNTIQRMGYGGNNPTVLLTAGVAAAAGVARCTSLAVDTANGRIFLVDGSGSIWSMDLSGAGVTALAAVPAGGAFPTGVALDAANQWVYFSVSSPVQSANSIQRVNYSGTGLTPVFTASGGVERCTALGLDAADGAIYLSDAGANSLWRISLASGTPTAVLPLPATAKKVRWLNAGVAAASPLPPLLTGLQLASISAGNQTFNLILSGTNGYSGGTYCLLTSTNLSTPLSQWQPVSTSALTASGSFTLTVSNQARLPGQFYLLRMQ